MDTAGMQAASPMGAPVNPKPAGLSRELARVWAMIALFQITFLIVNTAPPIIGRLIFGAPSLIVS
jgi:hypothetical protein